jgi:NitT/TauT family transport system substrate-binding protein
MTNEKGSRRVIGRRLVGSVLVACVVGLLGLAAPRAAEASEGGRKPVSVLVPDTRDLRLLAFWVALGAGDFAREGLDVTVLPASSPATLRTSFAAGPTPVALLSGTDYERLVSDRFPFVLAANLLQNDPTELLIRRDVAKRLEVTERMPVAQRLAALHGVTLGVAVPDRGRLYQLFRSQGGDADSARLSVRKGGEQVAALQTGELDGAYLATPFLEQALDQEAFVLVDAAAGDIPTFAERMIEALAVTSAFAKSRPGDVQALIRALATAEHTLRFEPAAAIEAVLRAVPSVTRPHATRVVGLYARAVPATPHVEAALLKREAAFYPVGGDVLNLKGVDLETYVFQGQPGGGSGSASSASTGSSSRATLVLLGALALLIALVVVLLDQREPPRDAPRDGAMY